MNFPPGGVVNTAYNVGLDSSGNFKIYASTTSHVVVDVTGYMTPGT